MTNLDLLKKTLLAAVASSALVACGDDSTELASPGIDSPAPAPQPEPEPEPEPDPEPSVKIGRGGIEYTSAGNCPTGTTSVTVGEQTHCQLTGPISAPITSDVTLTAGNIYQLSGQVVIGSDTGADGTAADGASATLTIEPGAVIYGATASDVLVIARGSAIEANGSASDPIVFTSALDLDLSDELGISDQGTHSGALLDEPFTSEWGGIVVNGAASINTCNGDGTCEAQGEGDSGLYGGDDDTDSSGTMRYIQVKYAGNPITADDELNGIAFQGVGSGTTLEFIQVHNGADDGIEFFGGTAQAKYVVITGADDDSLDWTQGWRGKAQHVIIIQNPAQPASDQGIEADNFGDGNDFLPRAQPQLSNFTIVGSFSRGGESDVGMLLREGTGANIWNSVVSDMGDACLDIDDTATFTAAGSSATSLTGTLTIESTLLGTDCAEVFQSDDNVFDLEAFFTNQANNVVGATSLSNRFINGSAENAVVATDPSAVDAFFDSVDYAGAVASSSAADNWTLNWTYGLNPDPECPSGTTTNTDGACVISGTYTNDLTLVSGLDYILDGRVVFGVDLGPDPANPLATGDAASLTIDPGVTIQGADPQSYLIISRGSQLNSNGTVDAPVTFTALNPETRDLDSDTSLWGGLVINGRATLNTCDGVGLPCEAQGEGDSGLFGGSDDTDDSGQIFYTRVIYAGNPITADDELNGIAFQGVGSGTEIDFLQVHNGADDGIEFFGGTAEAKHVVITGADDDSLDWTQGWRGKIQHLLIIQNPNQPASDQGIEADNFGDGNDFLPRAQPMIANATIVGSLAAGGETDVGVLLREGTGANLWNVVVAQMGDACLDIDDTATFTAAGTSATDLTGTLTIESALLSDSCAEVFQSDDNVFDLEAYFTNQANNQVGTDSLTALAGAEAFKTYINGAVEANVTFTDVSAIDSFFDAVTAVGAVPDANNDWTLGWTVWLDR
ncbi:MAG: hypothetical protein JJ850_06130 [Kordiimonadaceae bacterium]|nr:hypothetical protein [Kordiimonadaceae bacterium]MBO6568097.1 hypothetical protein [Kordiimonadaceae bacterium]MBO6964173.1 hypothetical protein [Kordiimonadaceae bacterium]